MTDYQQILSDQKDGVLTLTLNRPDRLNAWTDVYRTMNRGRSQRRISYLRWRRIGVA